MKKMFTILIPLLLLTGCGEKTEQYSCFFQNTYENSEFTTNVDVEIKNDIITNATAVMTFKDESLATSMCNVLKHTEDSSENLICESNNITINNYQRSISSEKITKDKFLEYMENQEFICEAK